jgi:hypothetical protein
MMCSGACTPHVPVGVEPGPSGAPGELVELAHREAPDAVAVELGERGHQHRADRDVDTDPEGVRAADDRQHALAGQTLDQAAVAREHPCVVDADTVAQEAIEGGPEAASDPHALQRLGQRLALGSGGDVEADEGLGPLDRRSLVGVDDVDRGEPFGDGFLDAVGDGCRAPLVVQRGRAVHRRHRRHRPARAFLEIGRDRCHVAERRRRQQELASRQLEQRDLPRPAPVGVPVVVELVQAGKPDIARRSRHQSVVGKDLGRAHEHRGPRVDRRVACRQPDLPSPEEIDEVEELLGDQRLDRRGPHRPATLVPGEQDAGYGDEALARTRRRGQHDVVTSRQGQRRLLLVRVQRAPTFRCPHPERVEHRNRVRSGCGQQLDERRHGSSSLTWGVGDPRHLRWRGDDEEASRSLTRPNRKHLVGDAGLEPTTSTV